MKELIICLGFLLSLNAYADNIKDTLAHNSKMNVELRHYLGKWKKVHANSKSLSSSNREGKEIHLAFYCTDMAAVKCSLEAMCIIPKVISPSILTAYVPADKIECLTEIPAIKRIVGKRSMKLSMENVRHSANITKVHDGVDLETPYTGKGVIVGVIDAGIEFDHIAFRESKDSTRIVAAWGMLSKHSQPIYGSANIIAAKTDGIDECHGTHVMGIAAGGKTMSGSNSYGVAPGAEIVAIGSEELSDADIFNGMDLIRDIAETEDKPWVVNCSWGLINHSHDGYEDFTLALSEYAQNKGHIVAASGNESDQYLHAMHEFSSDDEKIYVLINHRQNDDFYINFVSEDTMDYKIEPYIYNTRTKEMTQVSSIKWDASGSMFYEWRNEYTNRYEKVAEVIVSGEYDEGLLDDYNSSSWRIAYGITGHRGQIIHSWVDDYSSFAFVSSPQFIQPDTRYSINSPAIGKDIICVGAYVSSPSYQSYQSQTISWTSDKIGDLCGFSSVGPSLDNLQKPDICAPGAVVSSAFNGRAKSFHLNSEVTEIRSFEGEKYYYGAMMGTSMAAPVVTGTLALWLEANPDLTQAQILEIFRKTSMPFDNQVFGEWDDRYGYGKIQAYEGLKEALRMSTGITPIRNSETPVTILKNHDKWRILFNNGESYARIVVYTSDGRQVYTKTLSHLERGQEEQVSFAFLPKGMYIVSIQTRNSSVAYKMAI